jgi:hypothetical protein
VRWAVICVQNSTWKGDCRFGNPIFMLEENIKRDIKGTGYEMWKIIYLIPNIFQFLAVINIVKNLLFLLIAV